jgi:hypothetical protein
MTDIIPPLDRQPSPSTPASRQALADLIRPSTDWKEVYLGGSPEKEREQHERWAQDHAAIQKAAQPNLGEVLRGQHASPLHSARARMEFYDELPEFARQGIVKAQTPLTGLARFSTGSSVPEKDDSKPGVRGLALALQTTGGTRQDFLMVNMDSFFKDTNEVMAIVRANVDSSQAPSALSSVTMLASTAKALGTARAVFLLERLEKQLKRPVQSLAAESYFGLIPIRWGPYAVKASLQPVNPPRQPPATDPTYLRDGLTAQLKAADLSFELCLQFYEDDQRTPIEDLTAPWQVPALPVARLILPRQDIDSPQGRATEQQAEALAFTPWNTQEHEPLGEIGRARKPIYALSAATRGACPYLSTQAA